METVFRVPDLYRDGEAIAIRIDILIFKEDGKTPSSWYPSILTEQNIHDELTRVDEGQPVSYQVEGIEKACYEDLLIDADREIVKFKVNGGEVASLRPIQDFPQERPSFMPEVPRKILATMRQAIIIVPTLNP